MVDAGDFTTLSSEHHYRGWAIDVRSDQVRLPDGTVVKRDVVGHTGAVAVVALDDHERVVMVRQYRHPVGEFLLELPAGLLDVSGEPALAAAQRELYEEASIRAEHWQVLLDLHTSPGMTDEAIRVFLAQGLSEVEEQYAREHEETTMTVQRIPLATLVAQVFAGELTNGPAVAGVLAAAALRAGVGHPRPVDTAWRGRPNVPAS